MTETKKEMVSTMEAKQVFSLTPYLLRKLNVPAMNPTGHKAFYRVDDIQRALLVGKLKKAKGNIPEIT